MRIIKEEVDLNAAQGTTWPAGDHYRVERFAHATLDMQLAGEPANAVIGIQRSIDGNKWYPIPDMVELGKVGGQFIKITDPIDLGGHRFIRLRLKTAEGSPKTATVRVYLEKD